MQEKAIKGCLFDFNGTVFFDTELHIEAFRRYSLRHGFEPMSRKYVVEKILGKTNSIILRENYLPDATSEDIFAFDNEKEGLYRELCLERPDMMRFAEGIYEFIEFLQKNSIPYCLATSSEITNINFYREHMDLDRWFPDDRLVYDNKTFNGKPAPDIYEIAAAKIGLAPKECVVFEDGTSGMLAAKNAGVGAIVSVYEEGLPSPVTEDISPFTVIHSYRDWKNIIKRLGIIN